MKVQDIKNLRVFKVKYIAPTNTRGSRVEIKESKRFFDDKDVKVTLSFDYGTGCILKQSIQYLTERGFDIICTGSEVGTYYIMVDSWGENFKELK